jgi:hypothetical protein
VKHKKILSVEAEPCKAGPAKAANDAKTPHYTSFYHKTGPFKAKKGELF